MIVKINNETIEIDEEKIRNKIKKRLEELLSIKIESKKSKILSEIAFLQKVLDENYLILDDYTSINTPPRLVCPNGHVLLKTTPKTFRRDTRCKYCSNLDKETAKQRFLKEAEDRGVYCNR